jgi:hypothetical protein
VKANLYLLIIPALLLSSCAPRAPRFDARAFEAGYEAAMESKDIAYFEELFSKDYWVGNQYQNREQALDGLRRIFKQYDDIGASFTIHSVQSLPGRRTLVINATLTLTGRPAGGGEVATINDVTGSAVYVFERGRWRLYKTVEKTLSVPS